MAERTGQLSFPKEKISVLILENIHPDAQRLFSSERYDITCLDRALSEDELIERIKDVSILCLRSATKVTERVLQAADRLLVIGAYCIGTNQIDLAAAAKKGVAVFNAPYSNTRSVVELALADMLALQRRLFEKSTQVHVGTWDKSARGAREIRGKTLGIVGYGNIGTQLSVIAEAIGMKVVFYDVRDRLAMGNAERADSLAELLAAADIVTVHVDGRAENTDLFNAAAFRQMKPGALFINLSRGHVVDERALAEALKNGRLGGAALDVYQTEPKSKSGRLSSPVQNLENVILTPHIGGSTEEAQRNIAQFVSNKIISFINTGDTALAVNLPGLSLQQMADSHRLIWIHKNEPGALMGLNQIFSEAGANITASYLGTMGDVGYAITDIGANHTPELIKKIKSLPQTIRLRVLY